MIWYTNREEFYRRFEERKKANAKRPIAEKMAIAEKLRNAERTLAPTRAANKAKRAAGKMEIRIKTA
jgi:hypothetical protein